MTQKYYAKKWSTSATQKWSTIVTQKWSINITQHWLTNVTKKYLTMEIQKCSKGFFNQANLHTFIMIFDQKRATASDKNFEINL